MKNTQVVPVSSGYELLCRPVPPNAYMDVFRSVPEPALPKVKIKSVTGDVEEASPLEDSEEFVAYKEAQRKWKREITQLSQDFELNYGIVGWRDVDSKETEFTDNVPKTWKLPAIMRAYKVEDTKDMLERRLQFIRYALILTDADEKAVRDVTTGRTFPLKDEEVTAAMTPFVSGTTKEGQ